MRGLRAPRSLLRGANGMIQASRSQAQAPLAARLITASDALAPTRTTTTAAPFAARPFSHSAPLQKEKKKSRQSPTYDSTEIVSRTSHTVDDADHDDLPGSKHPKPDPADPLNFADVASRLASLAAHHTEVLKLLQSGDRFSPDAIGALTVQPSRKDPTTYPLRELAEIVPRPGGRTVSLLLHEKDYVKPVMAAVQASPDFNQQPQRDPDNELELVLKIEATNKDVVVRRAKDAAQAWREKMRTVTEKRKKLHAKWQKDKAIVPDLKKRADKELQKLQDKEMKVVDAAEQQAVKKIQG
ncbi:ribosomal recycling factor [Colletotrichum graminicola]|uniref:Ribosomal recycling factor n=1 Tax=Colletotrichum graminicola (strain M1.001 / M2 / FGSC 10212) TaxID=645133 RepID=E3Q3I7_COLGM|nr:ribosomal recycling factor [Colletotrichum graminicola M1.001]EFQ25589.1 ribosomal recycling factor [Colletotrichum graminicola M1.001]WDK11101.1 ribosomal recycling factor [Colletotrichum graminicola]